MLTDPAHPYTRALISAIPVPGVPLTTTPATNYPVLDDGCPFRERCTAAAAICASEPPIVEVGQGWRSWCHFASGGV